MSYNNSRHNGGGFFCYRFYPGCRIGVPYSRFVGTAGFIHERSCCPGRRCRRIKEKGGGDSNAKWWMASALLLAVPVIAMIIMAQAMGYPFGFPEYVRSDSLSNYKIKPETP